MQSQDSTHGPASAVKHPDATEWMAYLYGEVALERRRELEGHLAGCANCASELAGWRAGSAALGDWKLPATRRRTTPALFPVLKWAAAAALVLGVGFLLGRQFSPAGAELAELKASVAQLAESVQRERINLTNSADIATAAANAETLRLLSGYSQLQAEQRTTDQQAIALTMRNFETRLGRLRTALETVALNTENGFEQTRENMTRLASFSMPLPNDPDTITP